jgi:molybdenum cofactor cytidylyltransferase
MTVGVLILAAGFSRRFNGDKRMFQPEGEKPLLQMTVEKVLAAKLDCRVCIRPDDVQVEALLSKLGVATVYCPQARLGMGATLAQGITAAEDWDGALIALGDMAWVQAQTYEILAAALTSAAIVQPIYEGRPGNPVGFSRQYYASLAALTGDKGGRSVLRRHREAVAAVPVADPGIHQDLDYIS